MKPVGAEDCLTTKGSGNLQNLTTTAKTEIKRTQSIKLVCFKAFIILDTYKGWILRNSLCSSGINFQKSWLTIVNLMHYWT